MKLFPLKAATIVILVLVFLLGPIPLCLGNECVQCGPVPLTPQETLDYSQAQQKAEASGFLAAQGGDDGDYMIAGFLFVAVVVALAAAPA